MRKKINRINNTLQPFSIKKELYRYLTDFPFMLCLCITALLMYGFFLTHNTISVDDLSGDRYYNGALFAQGRYTSTIIHKLLGLTNEGAWVLDLLGVLCLMASAISLCVLFDRYIRCTDKLPKIVFACLLISAPIYAELFAYNSCTLSVGGGMLLVSLALLYMTRYLQQGGKRNIAVASVLIAIVTSWYESIIIIYIGAVFAILLLQVIQSSQKLPFRALFSQGLVFAIPLIIGVASEFLIQTLISLFVDFGIKNYAKNQIAMPEGFGIVDFLTDILFHYVLAGIWYPTIAIFVVFAVLAVALCIVYSRKKKTWSIVVLFLGLAFSIFALSFLTLAVQPYRVSQIIGFFDAFIAYLFVYTLLRCKKHRTFLRKAVLVLSAYIILFQVSQFNYWIYWDTVRYEEERNVMIRIAQDLQEFDTSKPVILIGNYVLSENITDHVEVKKGSLGYKIVSSIPGSPWRDPEHPNPLRITRYVVTSYISWGVKAFDEPNTELHKFWNYLGYSFEQGTMEMYDEAVETIDEMPGWPADGSIVDRGDYIVIRLGNN